MSDRDRENWRRDRIPKPIAVCAYCDRPVNPNDPTLWRRVQGWERMAGVRASGKHGGSDITLRELVGGFACDDCVTKRRAGVNEHQLELA